MALLKTRPAFPAVREDLGDVFERFFRQPFAFSDMPTMETRWAPNLDFSETETEYHLKVDVPGIPKENLDVSIENNILTLTGHREFKQEKETDTYIWREREEGRFVRSLRLPTEVDEAKIDAKVHDGVLTVVIPKTEKALKSRIMIK